MLSQKMIPFLSKHDLQEPHERREHRPLRQLERDSTNELHQKVYFEANAVIVSELQQRLQQPAFKTYQYMKTKQTLLAVDHDDDRDM